MKILAIETATDACSAALLIGNQQEDYESNDKISVEFELAARKHTQLILPQVEKLLASAELTLQDLDAIAFGQGPGAFTGLRIAAGVTQGLALAADLPVIPISTLAAMAQQSYQQLSYQQLSYQQHNVDHFLVALDARINEVYWGKYEITSEKPDRVSLVGNEQVILPQNIEPLHAQDKDVQWIGIGSGWHVYEDELRSIVNKDQLVEVYPTLSPSAEFIAQLATFEYKKGNVLAVEDAQPIYLRDKVAETTAEREAKQG